MTEAEQDASPEIPPEEPLFYWQSDRKRPLASYWLMLGSFAVFSIIAVWIVMFHVKNAAVFGAVEFAVFATVAVSLVIGINHHINFFGSFKYCVGSLKVDRERVELGLWRFNTPEDAIIIPLAEIETAIDVTNWGVTTLKIVSKETRTLYEISEDELWTEERLEQAYIAIQTARGRDPWTGEELSSAEAAAQALDEVEADKTKDLAAE